MSNNTLIRAGTALGVASLAVSVPTAMHMASFDGSGIRFETHTLIKFAFEGANGAFLSKFGVAEVNNGVVGPATTLITESGPGYDLDDAGNPLPNFASTCGNAVDFPCEAAFMFAADTTYTLFLDNFVLPFPAQPNQAPGFLYTVYSTPDLNDGAMTGNAVAAQFGSDLMTGTGTVLWEDFGGQDGELDYDDVLIGATLLGAVAPLPTKTPEPSVLLGLSVAVGGLLYRRRTR